MLSLTYLSEYTRTSAGTLETTQSTVKGLIFFKSDFRHLLSLLPCIKLRKPKSIGFKQDIYYSKNPRSSTKIAYLRCFPREKILSMPLFAFSGIRVRRSLRLL